MATLKPVILAQHRRDDGSYPLKIRLTHKGRVVYFPTNITVSPSEVTRGRKIKAGQALLKGGELIEQMRSVLGDLSPFSSEIMDVRQMAGFIRERIRAREFHLDFFEFAAEWLSSNGKKKVTNGIYASAVNNFKSFIEGSIDINSIDKQLLLDFVVWCEGKGRNVAQVSIMRLHTIFREARYKYNDEDNGICAIPRDPFAAVQADVRPYQGQQPLADDIIQKLICYNTDIEGERLTVDLLVVSFGLMGANTADLIESTPPASGVWEYRRKKTRDRRQDHSLMRIRVPAVIAPYIRRIRESGLTNASAAHRLYHKYLPAVCKSLGVPPFTSYAMRKSWATIARRLGVEKALVDECLAHVGDFHLTDIYARRNFERMWEANDKVLSQFSWEYRE